MTPNTNNRSYKVISLFIKAAVFILSFWYIFQKLYSTDSFANLKLLLEKANLQLLVITFFLMFINWGLEAYKWKILIAPLEPISFSKALKSVFTGVTVSIFMPNRVGEFAGRIFYLEKADKINATLKTFVGSFMQFSVTLIVGIVAFFSFTHTSFSNAPVPRMGGYKTMIIVLLAFVLFLGIIFFLYKNRDKWSVKWRGYLSAIFELSRRDFLTVYFLSAFRYSVFLIQYFLVLKALNVEMSLVDGCLLIAITFLVTSVIPTFALTEIVTRGATAAYFFYTINADPAVVVTGSLVVWIINLAIPALIGSVFIWKLKLFKQ